MNTLFSGSCRDLWFAACTGDVDSIISLVCNRGMEVDARQPGSGGMTPLMYAVIGQHVEAVATLLSAGASPHLKSDDNRTAVNYAMAPIGERSLAILRLLLAAGADVESRLPGSGETLLMLSAHYGDAASVSALIDAGADVNASASGLVPWTPIIWAALGGHAHVIHLLLNAGADTDTITPSGNTALDFALLQGAAAAAAALIEAGTQCSNIANMNGAPSAPELLAALAWVRRRPMAALRQNLLDEL